MQRSPWKIRKEWVAKKTRAEDAAAKDPGEKLFMEPWRSSKLLKHRE